MEAKKSGVQCRICPRTFASQKAVHGHMRTHSRSERQAERRDPGQGSAVESAPLLEDVRSPEERKDLLQGFSRTGKRWSYKRRTQVLEGPWTPVVGETPTPQPPFMEERRRTDLLPRFARTGKRWSFNRRAAGPVAPASTSQPPLMEETQNMELASVAADGTIQAQNDHVCSKCMRAFSSPLALGGHKAHHSMREKKRLAAMEEEEDDDYTAADEQASVVYELIPPHQHRRHVAGPQPCLKCGKIFSTGKALGAHERHCKEPPPPPPPPRVEHQNKVVHGFDLNEMPPPEEEEEV